VHCQKPTIGDVFKDRISSQGYFMQQQYVKCRIKKLQAIFLIHKKKLEDLSAHIPSIICKFPIPH